MKAHPQLVLLEIHFSSCQVMMIGLCYFPTGVLAPPVFISTPTIIRHLLVQAGVWEDTSMEHHE